MNLIDEIKQRISIVDLARKMGREPNRSMFIHSIYKDERTPSLRLYPETNSFHCFATSQGGSVIDFYKGAYNVDTKTAIRELAQLYNITATDNGKPQRKVVTPPPKAALPVDIMDEDERYIFDETAGKLELEGFSKSKAELQALNEVRKYRIEQNTEVFEEMYRYCFAKGFSSAAFEYLTRFRKLERSILTGFKIFEIQNYYEVNQHLKKVFPLERLQRSGLFNDKGNLIFFKHRIIIPYQFNGRIVYLRGRFFDEEGNTKTDGTKYLGLRNDALGVNTPKRFFNIDVLSFMFPLEKLYITEGEFDCMAVRQLGFNALAVPGAGNMPADKEFKKLFSFNVVICGDNDEAGEGLIQKLTEKFYALGRAVKIKKLPTKDVNEFIME